MKFRLSLLLIAALSTGDARADQVTYDVSWAATNYPSIAGSYSGCGYLPIEGLPIEELPIRVVAATFDVTGTVIPGVYLCPDQPPWAMEADVLLLFLPIGRIVESTTVTYQEDFAASLDLTIGAPIEVGQGYQILVCFTLQPVHPVCVAYPWPTGIVYTATVTLEYDSIVPVETSTWGQIKALYR